MPPKMQHFSTRTTKRGGANSVPDDPFKMEPEVSMAALADTPSNDGRNPMVTTGKAIPSEFDGGPSETTMMEK